MRTVEPWPYRTRPSRLRASATTVGSSTSVLESGAELRELFGDPLGGGASPATAGCQRTFDGQHVSYARGEQRRDRGEVVIGEVPQLDATLFAHLHTGTGDLVGV